MVIEHIQTWFRTAPGGCRFATLDRHVELRGTQSRFPFPGHPGHVERRSFVG